MVGPLRFELRLPAPKAGGIAKLPYGPIQSDEIVNLYLFKCFELPDDLTDYI